MAPKKNKRTADSINSRLALVVSVHVGIGCETYTDFVPTTLR